MGTGHALVLGLLMSSAEAIHLLMKMISYLPDISIEILRR